MGDGAALLQPITSAALRAQSEICTHPVTTHAAKDARHPSDGPWEGVHVLAGTWSIDRMRADKPGWQTDEDKASLAFDLKFGAKPRLTIVYEQSYERFGDAVLTVHSAQRRGTKALYRGTTYGERVLHGRDATDNSNTTQATTVVFQVGPDTTDGLENWNVQPHGNATFVLTTRRGDPDRTRFKVRRVSSC